MVGLTTIRTYRQKLIVMRRGGDDRFKKYEKWCDTLTILRQSDCKIYGGKPLEAMIDARLVNTTCLQLTVLIPAPDGAQGRKKKRFKKMYVAHRDEEFIYNIFSLNLQAEIARKNKSLR